MATTNDQTQLVGLFKDKWGNTVIEGFGFMADLSKEIDFEEGKAIGGKFHVATDLQLENGFSYAASGVTPSGTTYLDPNAGITVDVQVTGASMHGRARLTYESMFRALSGDRAVEPAVKRVVSRLGKSGLKRLEIAMLHGQLGIGALSVVAGSGTTRTWTLSDETWSSGIWAGLTGATLDVYPAADLTDKRNDNAAVVVTGVIPANKQITVSGNSSDLTAIVATDILFFETSSAASDMVGLHKIASNTSGTIHNVSASTYELWGGNVYSTSTGTLAFRKLLEAASGPASYGLYDELRIVCAPKAYETLNTDTAGLRRYDASYSSSKNSNGSTSLEFHGQTGKLRVKASPFQQDGKVVAFCPTECSRIGSTDLTFIQRHGDGEKLILETAGSPTTEMRTYSFQSVYAEQPRHTFYMSGITY